MDNCFKICNTSLESFKVSFTQKFLREKILTCSQHPNLIAISYTLEEHGVESLAAKLGPNRLDDFLLPEILHFHVGVTHFNVIRATSKVPKEYHVEGLNIY